ncbi:MAG: CehA/McbA family metallohydrolase [Pseudomonadota bacterium]|nr:CehA/McbA family metallohydrolase [Pseudomonadota bacterium]
MTCIGSARKRYLFALVAAVWLSSAAAVSAQWTNRYPKVETFAHQLYLEQEHLPILSSGPVYPAPSPDGTSLAFAHQGWIWLLDLSSGVARRLTNASGVDARPSWSPDGKRIALIRDSGSDTSIVIVGLDGTQLSKVDTPAIDLDPTFTKDGKFLIYTSARGGRLDLWRRNLDTGLDEALTSGARVARSARALRDGRILYQEAVGPAQALRLRNADGTAGPILFQQGWMAHLNPDAHPVERAIVYGVGEGNMVRLAVMDVDNPAFPRWLTPATGKALFPAWSADGSQIYYVLADAKQQFRLMVVGAAGGTPRQVQIRRWDYGAQMGELAIATGTRGRGGALGPTPARLSITRADGHPIANPHGSTFVDNQNGPVYFYTDGRTTLQLPEGNYRIVATHGPFSLPQAQEVRVVPGRSVAATLHIAQIWDADRAGYASADHHVHLNGSGVNELELPDLLLPMQGEDLDFAAPMAWNQYNRFIDADRIGQKAAAKDGTSAWLTQEVRSDYHGHVGMIGATEPFQPWFFGPTTPVYGNRELHNGLVNRFAKAQGALATYVHAVRGDSDPFADLAVNGLPYELVVDGVLSDGMGLELVCQWTSPLGTAQAWYRFLNMGRTMPATSGTDMMANFYRVPAIGTARAYVPATNARDGYASAVEQVRSGQGFVTTGPALLFEVDGKKPGSTVPQGSRNWSIDLISVRPVERVEIVVNGQVVQTLEGFAGKGRKRYAGKVDLPLGGWIAARAVGGETAWPIMSYAHFAHSQPLWINRIGSTEPLAARTAAKDLLKALAYSEGKFRESYGAAIPAGLVARIGEARRRLSQIAAE